MQPSSANDPEQIERRATPRDEPAVCLARYQRHRAGVPATSASSPVGRSSATAAPSASNNDSKRRSTPAQPTASRPSVSAREQFKGVFGRRRRHRTADASRCVCRGRRGVRMTRVVCAAAGVPACAGRDHRAAGGARRRDRGARPARACVKVRPGDDPRLLGLVRGAKDAVRAVADRTT